MDFGAGWHFVAFEPNLENIENPDESITGSPILQISSNGNKKPQHKAGAIYAFPRVIILKFVDVR
jgi:hypothetical protein